MDLKSLLNTQQYDAVTSHSQHLRIIAGAGTGKTRTLTYRIAYLITQGIRPNTMLAITFTNKAAKEMLDRVTSILEEENFPSSRKPLISTFHGFCYRFLMKEISHLDGYNINFTIADDEDQNQIFKDVFKEMVKGSSKDFCKSVVNKISKLKTEGVFVSDVTPDMVPYGEIYDYNELMFAYDRYQKLLKKQNFLDFDDLLMLTYKVMASNDDVRLSWSHKYKAIFVDEFQDTNTLQYKLVKQFMNESTMLTVVGDPDQTIYTWRGAKNRIIKDQLQKDFADLDTVILDQNYRSTQTILDSANMLISRNTDRVKKDLVAANGIKGDGIVYYDASDADVQGARIAKLISGLREEGVSLSDIAVIYRSNYLSSAIEKKLTENKIPYDVYGGLKFFERAEIKDALSYLRLALNPNDDFSFKRILKAPTKGLGEVSMAKALAIADNDESLSLVEVFRSHRDEIGSNSKSKKALDIFFDSYDRFLRDADEAQRNKKPADLISAVRTYFITSGFMDYVASEDKKLEEKTSYTNMRTNSKQDNVNELLGEMTSYFDTDIIDEDGVARAPTLWDFLISVSLQSDQDGMQSDEKVSLMTGHVSKGLEFPYVFIAGLNQGIFPTSHAMMDGPAAMEEERRLLYVCVTRAQKQLYLFSFGGFNYVSKSANTPSQFLKELNLTGKKEIVTAQKMDYNTFRGPHRPAAPAIHSVTNVGNLTRNDAKSTDHYEVGDKVAHISFGVGTVTEVLPGNKINVFFPQINETKKLMVGFKAFRKVEE